MMKKILLLVLPFIIMSCSEDNSLSDYYSVENINIVSGSSHSSDEKSVLIAESHNNSNQSLDFIADYPNDNTVGRLAFKYDIKNLQSDVNTGTFSGTGSVSSSMSTSFSSNNFDSNSILPIFENADSTKRYRVKFRLKGDFHVTNSSWHIDNIYPVLSKTFNPNLQTESNNVFFSKGNTLFMDFYQMDGFNSLRRAGTFDVEYDGWNLSFDKLYFNLFVSLTGSKSTEPVHLDIDKESYFEIYEVTK